MGVHINMTSTPRGEWQAVLACSRHLICGVKPGVHFSATHLVVRECKVLRGWLSLSRVLLVGWGQHWHLHGPRVGCVTACDSPTVIQHSAYYKVVIITLNCFKCMYSKIWRHWINVFHKRSWLLMLQRWIDVDNGASSDPLEGARGHQSRVLVSGGGPLLKVWSVMLVGSLGKEAILRFLQLFNCWSRPEGMLFPSLVHGKFSAKQPVFVMETLSEYAQPKLQGYRATVAQQHGDKSLCWQSQGSWNLVLWQTRICKQETTVDPRDAFSKVPENCLTSGQQIPIPWPPSPQMDES